MSAWYTFNTTLGTERVELPAAGLHLYGTKKTFMLDEIQDRRGPKKVIWLGRDKVCDIHIRDDRTISGRHAIIRRRKGPIWEISNRSRNGVLINGEPIEEPTRLMLGMQLRIGKSTRLFTCDHHRLVPIAMSLSVDETCYLANKMYGTYAEASRRYDLGREFVREHAQKWGAQMMGERP